MAQKSFDRRLRRKAFCRFGYQKKGIGGKKFQNLPPRILSDQHRLNYLHLMNKAAESEDRQSYFHYLQQAEQVLRDTDEDEVWQPAD